MADSKVDSRWLKGLSDEDREIFKRELLGNKKVLDKLHEIVYNIVKSDEDVRLSDYKSPSWSHEQAHRNGRVDALKSILSLLEFSNE